MISLQLWFTDVVHVVPPQPASVPVVKSTKAAQVAFGGVQLQALQLAAAAEGDSPASKLFVPNSPPQSGAALSLLRNSIGPFQPVAAARSQLREPHASSAQSVWPLPSSSSLLSQTSAGGGSASVGITLASIGSPASTGAPASPSLPRPPLPAVFTGSHVQADISVPWALQDWCPLQPRR
jgi:hypothetical protein